MNRFTSPHGLPPLTILKNDRERQINSLINNLKINDVRDEKDFEKTAMRIKMDVLLTPVVIGEPRMVDYEYHELPLTMQQQLIGGMSRNHYVHSIAFPVTGDDELMCYCPEQGFSFSSSDHGLIFPEGNEITVEVDLPEPNPDQAILQARHLLGMTLQFANTNNASIKSWNTAVGQRIDDQLKKKREELIRIFGGK